MQQVQTSSLTPAERRYKLFKTWEKIGNVQATCRQHQVSRGTFYYWKARFDKGGYPALLEERSRVPRNPTRIAPALESQILALKQEHPQWGKWRIAREIVACNEGVSSMSPNTVRRVLQDAGMWQM